MSKTNFDFDVIVIGAGYGGFDAAKHAAESGLKVAIVESREMGGTNTTVYDSRMAEFNLPGHLFSTNRAGCVQSRTGFRNHKFLLMVSDRI